MTKFIEEFFMSLIFKLIMTRANLHPVLYYIILIPFTLPVVIVISFIQAVKAANKDE